METEPPVDEECNPANANTFAFNPFVPLNIFSANRNILFYERHIVWPGWRHAPVCRRGETPFPTSPPSPPISAVSISSSHWFILPSLRTGQPPHWLRRHRSIFGSRAASCPRALTQPVLGKAEEEAEAEEEEEEVTDGRRWTVESVGENSKKKKKEHGKRPK